LEGQRYEEEERRMMDNRKGVRGHVLPTSQKLDLRSYIFLTVMMSMQMEMYNNDI